MGGDYFTLFFKNGLSSGRITQFTYQAKTISDKSERASYHRKRGQGNAGK